MKILSTFLFAMLALSTSNVQISFTEYTLDNGLHVILHQNRTNPIVTVSVLYHVGSKNESPKRTGFAHFFEHLMFEGSENIGRGEFFKHIQSNGGTGNAYTQQDHTYYYETLPSNQLKLALWLESERMLHARVDQKGIDTQREVVKEEKRMRYDNQPYNIAFWEEIPALLFKKHPYRFSVIGSMEDLNAAKEEDYKKFYEIFYVPNNATLTIAGNINLEEAKKWIEAYFGTIPKGKIVIPRPHVLEAPLTSEVVSIYQDKNAQVPAVILAYRAPKKTDKDAYVLKIIDRILSSGESSRIAKNVVNKRQLASEAGAFLSDMEDYGIFLIYAITNSGVPLDEVVNALDEEIDRLKKDGIGQKELEKQINALEKSFIDGNNFMEDVAHNLSNYHVYFKNTNMINTVINKYQSISVEDIKRVTNRYLNNFQRVRLYNLPKSQ
ncbi:M16 family metallopeptidase [Bacteroidetes bacterium endosymbiont of Geopemphigus sp.]|uniref:M16 family metallopeptidase n=1 Tax=Bacteroidetes bacterium endosymbiont of Geopemphigus sp. TaxID=2047937 RepID=UPI000CD01D6D|nr:pitrilysin family protein [Bacteroidetes bacterium endosymbiont of Geopemphigus sp.]